MPQRNNQTSVHGLLLAGGKSRRMGMDKANLRYGPENKPQWKRMTRLLSIVCGKVFISLREGQVLEGYCRRDGELIEDGAVSQGPLTGLLAAHAHFPEAAWLVVACDLPLLDEGTLRHLLSHRGEAPVIAYTSANDGLPEPLCTLYEPPFFPILETAMRADVRCPRKILMQNPGHTRLLELPRETALENANTPGEYEHLQAELKGVAL